MEGKPLATTFALSSVSGQDDKRNYFKTRYCILNTTLKLRIWDTEISLVEMERTFSSQNTTFEIRQVNGSTSCSLTCLKATTSLALNSHSLYGRGMCACMVLVDTNSMPRAACHLARVCKYIYGTTQLSVANFQVLVSPLVAVC